MPAIDLLKSYLQQANGQAPQTPDPADTAQPGDQVTAFARAYAPAAQRAGSALGVDPSLLLAQWGEESGWGKSVVPGTNNLGNIKDFSGGGVAATDNQTGSSDNYQAFADPGAFADHYAGLIQRKYPGAVGAGSDAARYYGALKAGGYAEDQNYASKLQAAHATLLAHTGLQPDLASGQMQPVKQAAADPYAAILAAGLSAKPPAPPAEQGSDLVRGVKASFQQLPQLGYGLLAGAGAQIENAVGEGGIATGIKKAGIAGYKDWGDTIQKDAKPSDSLTYSWDQAKQGNLGALADWLAYGIGYSGGQGAQMLATGGLGSIAGKAGATVVAEKLAAGMVAKEAARIAATREGAALATDQLTKVATANVAAHLGQTAAIGANAFGMEGGEIYGDLTSANPDKVLDGHQLAKAFGATLAAGGLEFVGDKVGLEVMLNKSPFMKPAEAMAGVTGKIARAGLGVAGGAPTEAATEYAQTMLEEYGKGNDPFSDDTRTQAIDAAGLGAIGGVTHGVAGGAISSPQQHPVAPGFGTPVAGQTAPGQDAGGTPAAPVAPAAPPPLPANAGPLARANHAAATAQAASGQPGAAAPLSPSLNPNVAEAAQLQRRDDAGAAFGSEDPAAVRAAKQAEVRRQIDAANGFDKVPPSPEDAAAANPQADTGIDADPKAVANALAMHAAREHYYDQIGGSLDDFENERAQEAAARAEIEAAERRNAQQAADREQAERTLQVAAAQADYLQKQHLQRQAELDAIHGRVEARQAMQSRNARMDLLDQVLADKGDASPAAKLRAFSARLGQAGYQNIAPSPDEIAHVQRHSDVASAFNAPEYAAPNELVDAVPERTAPAPAPATVNTAAVDAAIAAGMRLKTASGNLLHKQGSTKVFKLSTAQKAHYLKRMAQLASGQPTPAAPSLEDANGLHAADAGGRHDGLAGAENPAQERAGEPRAGAVDQAPGQDRAGIPAGTDAGAGPGVSAANEAAHGQPALNADQGHASDIIDLALSEIRRPNGAIGTQGVTESQVRDVLEHAAGLNLPAGTGMRALVDAIKADPAAQARLRAFTAAHPIQAQELPDGSLHLKDGHHRAFLLNQLGDATVPAQVQDYTGPSTHRPAQESSPAEKNNLPTPKAEPTPPSGEPAHPHDPAVADLAGHKLDREWTAFAPDSGTLGIPREDMPQIKAEHRGALTQFLKARGIGHEQEEVLPSTLKATQREFSHAKVEQAKAHEGGDRAILVSSDNRVLDGHHQWLANLEDDKPIRVIRFDAPIEKLIAEAKEFPSAEAAEGATAPEAGEGQAPGTETPARPSRNSEAWRNEGKTPEQLIEERADDVGRELASQVAEEVRDPDFDLKDLPRAVAQWAADARVPADAVRQGLLKALERFDIQKGMLAKIRNALNPTKAAQAPAAPLAHGGTPEAAGENTDRAPADVLNNAGKPFTMKFGAEKALKDQGLSATHEVVKTADGYVGRVKQDTTAQGDAAHEAEPKAAAPQPAPAEQVPAPTTTAHPASPRSSSAAVNDFIDGKRDAPPSLEEVAAEQAPVDPIDAELQDALGHLGDVLGDVFGAKLNMTGKQHGAGDLLPALSKVIELLVRKGFKSFAAAVGASAKAMRGNPSVAEHLDKVSARQWKAAYNAIAEYHEGTDSEEAVAAVPAEQVLRLVAGEAVEQKVTEPPAAKAEATVEDNSDVNPGEYMVRAKEGNYLARFSIGRNGRPVSVRYFYDAQATKNVADAAIEKYLAERNAEQAAPEQAAPAQPTDTQPPIPAAPAEPELTTQQLNSLSVKAMTDAQLLRAQKELPKRADPITKEISRRGLIAPAESVKDDAVRVEDFGTVPRRNGGGYSARVTDGTLWKTGYGKTKEEAERDGRSQLAIAKQVAENGRKATDHTEAAAPAQRSAAPLKVDNADDFKRELAAGNTVELPDGQRVKMNETTHGWNYASEYPDARGIWSEGSMPFIPGAKVVRSLGNALDAAASKFARALTPATEKTDAAPAPVAQAATIADTEPVNESTDTKEQANDSTPAADPAALDHPVDAGYVPAGSSTPARGAELPRDGTGRADAGRVREPGGRAEGADDARADLGHGAGADAVSGRPDGDLAAGGRPVSADFHPAPGGLTREGSWFDTAKRNIDLIELARRIEAENRPATPEEQAQLAKYVGFGASAIRNVLFPVPPSYSRQQEPNRLIWPNLIHQANWKALAERLEALPPEWQKSVLQSSQYAHYTSENIIRSTWSAMQRLGFTGGKVFEPGMGIGSFAMLMPDSISQTSRYTGVEFDGPTALIAKLLSPQQNVLHDDFIKRKFPKDFFDVAIGNPPFSQTKIFGDPDYQKHGFMLHDFFFAKALDSVRPGGLLAFVTSKGTMDKQSDKARNFLAARADLVGAVRLPSTAFEDNAGTSVVTDVLFLRKRAPGEAPAGESWKNVATIDTKDGPAVVNEYYAAHPDMVLGQNRISGNMDDEGRRINANGRNEQYTVVSYDKTPAELDAKFAAAVERLPQNVYSVLDQSPASVVQETAKVDFDPRVKREGVVYLADDGTVMRVEHGVGRPLADGMKMTDKDHAWFRGYVGLRDLVQDARHAQVTEGDWKKALKKLNQAYDAFRKEHGPINDFRVQVRKSTDEQGNVVETESRVYKNRRRFREDYDAAILTQLETINEAGEIVKAPFLQGRTIGVPVTPEVKTIGDALAVSLDNTGRLDLDDVARRIDMTRDEAIEALGNQVYKTPGGEWQLADEYLAGDVVAKLEEAEQALRLDESLRRNVEALKEAQPEKLGPSQISAKLGASWIPEAHVNAFAQEIEAGKVTFDPVTETWQVAGGNERNGRRAGAEYGTAKRSPSELLEAALNSRAVKVMYDSSAGKDLVGKLDQTATTTANEALKKIKDKFKGWVWTDTERATELVDIYNKRYNNIAPRKFDGSHLTLPGVSLRYKLHPHQLRAIWRIIQTGDTYLAHAVGAGKTIEMIAAGMEQKRLGLISKPMYVVPNHMLEQFSNEFMELYPLANIMVADDENFSAERRKAFVASATLNKPDAVIITHDAFQRIGVKEESVAPIRDEILADLENELEETAKGHDTRVRRSQLEQQIEAVNQRFDRIIGAGGKDSTIKFEDIGADFIFADESHAYRKLDFHTAQQIKGIDPNGSKRALDMYVKTRWLERQRPGRAMVFASGTPVTNTMGELYTIMRYFAPHELERAGISTFDAWARQFGEVAPALEPNAAGKYELIERFAKFDNVPELMSRVRQFMDVLTSDHLGALVKRPDLKDGKPNLDIVEPSEDLQAYMKGELARRIDISKAWKPTKEQPANPDPIVAIITDGRFAAIDPRFFGGKLGPEGSIITRMADKVVASYHAGSDNEYLDKNGQPEPIKGSTQIVFYNLGFGQQSMRSRGFDARAAFTKRLTDGGIPRNQIAWFDDADTDAKKEAVFKDMRSGKLRVLIGSAKKMGTGVNVQKRLEVLHYQDPPWFPADVEQPHGRIIRQGNQNGTVGIEWYATKGTYQSTMWQMVARKQRFIDQAFTGDKTLRSMDDMGEASLFEQAAAVASGDPRAIQLAGLKQDVDRFERLQTAHASEQINVRSALRSAEWQVERATKAIATYGRAFKVIGERMFSFTTGTVGRQQFDKQGEFGQALKDAFNETAADGMAVESKKIASLGENITLSMTANRDHKDALDGTYGLYVHVGDLALPVVSAASLGETVDATGLARKVVNRINGIDTELREAKRSLTAGETDVNKLRRKVGAPFEYQQEMAEKYGDLKRLEEELRAEGAAKPAAPVVVNQDGTGGDAPADAVPPDSGQPEAGADGTALMGKLRPESDADLAPMPPELAASIASLAAGERQALAAHYGAPAGSAGFMSRLLADVVAFVNHGAQMVAAAIRSIVQKIAHGVLATALVFNPQGTSNIHFDLDRAFTQTKVAPITAVADAAVGMSPMARATYEMMAPVAMQRGKGFIIADKPSAQVHAFDKNGKHVASSAALFGKQAGDVKTTVNAKGQRITVHNMTEADKITPAGAFIGRIEDDAGYTGGRLMMLYDVRTGKQVGGVAVHAVWTGDAKEQRRQRLASPDLRDHKISFGCINTNDSFMLDKLLPLADQFDDGLVLIVPEQKALGEVFTPLTGTVTETGIEHPHSAGRRALPEMPGKEETPYHAEANDEREGDAAGDEPDGLMGSLAYHGTPHHFDKFTMDHLGSGEGAQAYGWGLYFAGERQVAEYYREGLTPAGGSGQLYTVDIPDDDQFLHLAKPLAEQPQQVKEALRAIADTLSDVGEVNRAAARRAESPRMQLHRAINVPDDGHTGRWAYNFIARHLGTDNWQDDRAASLLLNQHGIPGAMYADQLSRGQRDQTFNYVLYDAGSVAIVDRAHAAATMGSQNTAPASTLDQSLHAAVEAGASAADLLHTITSESTDPGHRALAAQLLANGVNPTIGTGSAEGQAFATGRAAQDYAASYDPKAHHVALYEAGGAERNLLHELVHAATAQALRAGGRAALQMKALYAAARRSGLLSGHYGMANIDEFVAEAHSNPAFQQALQKVGGERSLWDRFVDIVRAVLGLAPSQRDMLSQVLAAGRDLMAENAGRADATSMGSIAQTATRAFRDWFGDSKVVNPDGTPMVVYHGTRKPSFTEFDPERSGAASGRQAAGIGSYFTENRESANLYTVDPRTGNETGAVMPVYLNIRNPYMANGWPLGQDATRAQAQAFTRDLKSQGYDGIIINHGGNREFVAFSPEQIKSATGNSGAFDPANPSIMGNLPANDPNAAASESPLTLAARRRFDQVMAEAEHWLNSNGKTAELHDLAPRWAMDSLDQTMYYSTGKFSEEAKAQGRAIWTRAEAAFKQLARHGGDLEGGAPLMGNLRDTPSLADALASAATNPKDINLWGGYKVGDFLDNTGKVGWWHKTIGTMKNLALKHPAFRPVYEAVQSFLSDVSRYATAAGDLAPRLMPQLENFKDIFGANRKQAVSAEDTRAIATPIFDGTLAWARDAHGKPVLVDELRKQAEALTPDQKAQILLQKGELDDKQYKAWRALPPDTHDAAVENRFEATQLQPGVVWSDAELRSMFNLNDSQISLYHEFRAAVDKSLTNLTISEMTRMAGKPDPALVAQAVAMPDLQSAAALLRDHYVALARMHPDMADMHLNTATQIMNLADKGQKLIDRGYAPLQRFGQYTVYMTEEGEEPYFGMYETAADAAQAARTLKEKFPQAFIRQGTMSQEEYKLFAGVSPESVELFGSMLGLGGDSDASDKAYQKYLQLTKANRSAMKRMIHRKGTAGYSEDVGRVLASFLYSNARLTSSNFHTGEIDEGVNEIPKEQGELKDQAVALRQHVRDPQTGGTFLSGLMFAQFLGGSVASAAVNFTQPVMTSLPYLSQWGGIGKAGSRLLAAVRDARKESTGDAALDATLEQYKDVVSPQEVHYMQAQAAGKATLRAGDGTKSGDLRAKANNTLAAVRVAWGKLFAMAEQSNRRITFIAAYRTAMEQGNLGDAGKFAAQAVQDTQFVANAGNKMAWGRNPVGGLLLTFKGFSIQYLEMLGKMAFAGAPGSPERAAGRRAVLYAMAVMLLMAGSRGIPFEQDLEAVIDGILQRMGYNFSSKRAMHAFLANKLGDGFADFAASGASGLPGAPFDMAGRLGAGHLIPGIGALRKKESYTSDVAEIAGPAADLVKRGFTAAGKAVGGDLAGAALDLSPQAVRNAAQGADMLRTGTYRDARGYIVNHTTPLEAGMKALGFQPNSTADIQDAKRTALDMISQARMRSNEIAEHWAQGRANNDEAMVNEARAMRDDWNAKNPDTPVRVSMPGVMHRARAMREDALQRTQQTAGKALKAAVGRELAAVRE